MPSNTALTIIDPAGLITSQKVTDFLASLGDQPLKVTGQRHICGETIIFVDHELGNAAYFDPELNDLLARVGNHFLVLGCEFSPFLDVCDDQARKIKGR